MTDNRGCPTILVKVSYRELRNKISPPVQALIRWMDRYNHERRSRLTSYRTHKN